MVDDRTRTAAKPCLAGLAMLLVSAWDQPPGPTKSPHVTLAQAGQVSPKQSEPMKQKDTLRVATYAGLPPLTFHAEDTNEIVGLEIDLARAIAVDLGVNITIFDTPFEAIIPGLLSKRFDVAITDMSDTTVRQQQVDFIDYAKSFSSIVVPKGNPGHVSSISDLCGKPVATQTSSMQSNLLSDQSEKCIAAGKEPIQILQVPNEAQVEMNLKTRRTVAQVRDYVLGAYEAEHSDGQLEIVSTSSGPAQVGASGLVGIAVPKGNPELVIAIKTVLEHVIADGRYAVILGKYDLRPLAVDHVTMNGRRD